MHMQWWEAFVHKHGNKEVRKPTSHRTRVKPGSSDRKLKRPKGDQGSIKYSSYVQTLLKGKVFLSIKAIMMMISESI